LTVGRRGPQPTPTRLRVLKGERPSRINHREPLPMPGVGEPPASLSALARPVWDEVVARIGATGVLTRADTFALEMFCEHVANHREMVAILRASSWLIKGARETRAEYVRHPVHQMLAREVDAIHRLGASLGLNPAARVGLSAPEGNAGSPRVEDLLSR
jgi:P27 family predicted phage terminase small subunit